MSVRDLTPEEKEQLSDLSPLEVIRTETILSKLPVHNLSKREKFDIEIIQQNDAGEIELQWIVQPNATVGEARQLAYKIDTLVINRRIDEEGRPIPKILRLGSLRQICEQLGLRISGRTASDVTRALEQNALTGITAKLNYKWADGSSHRIRTTFTRYGVVLTGKKLPNGQKADGVYILFNEPYLGIISNAPVRPINYGYLKELTTGAQRFYELVSYKIFAALKYKHPEAKLSYADYCTFAPQLHYNDKERAQKQMYKIHRPHLASGYLKSVRYQTSTDRKGNVDWIISYTPGPKAIAEYRTFNQPTQRALFAVEQEPQVDQPLELVQRFHEKARGTKNYTPYKGSREVTHAQSLLSRCGLERASFIVDFAISEAPKTKFEMKNFAAVLQYQDQALTEYEKSQSKRLAGQKQRETDERISLKVKQANQRAIERLEALPKAEYDALHDQIKADVRKRLRWLPEDPKGRILEGTIRAAMVREMKRRETAPGD